MLRSCASAVCLALAISACSPEEAAIGSTESAETQDGFTDLFQADIQFPQNPDHPLTLDDVTVVKGFDGKTPEEVATIVRSRLKTKAASTYNELIHDRTIEVHKHFTLWVSNCFAPDYPSSDFVKIVAAAEGTRTFIEGTIRGDIYLVTRSETDGEQYYLAKGNTFDPIAVASGFKSFTPPVMVAEIRLEPQGVKIEYPTWEWEPLAHEPTITEVGSSSGVPADPNP